MGKCGEAISHKTNAKGGADGKSETVQQRNHKACVAVCTAAVCVRGGYGGGSQLDPGSLFGKVLPKLGENLVFQGGEPVLGGEDLVFQLL